MRYTRQETLFRANQGDAHGNGLFINPVGSGSSIIFVSNSDVIQNNGYANSGGGGIYAYVSSGASLSLSVDNAKIDNNGSYQGGGIFLYPDSSTLTASITNSTISGNSGDPGGGVYIYTNNSNSSSFEFTGNTISNNKAGNYPGGGIVVYANSSTYTLYLEKNIISGNTGPQVYIDRWQASSSLALNLKANQILSNLVPLAGPEMCGGGLRIGNVGTLSGELENNIIVNNKASCPSTTACSSNSVITSGKATDRRLIRVFL